MSSGIYQQAWEKWRAKIQELAAEVESLREDRDRLNDRVERLIADRKSAGSAMTREKAMDLAAGELVQACDRIGRISAPVFIEIQKVFADMILRLEKRCRGGE